MNIRWIIIFLIAIAGYFTITSEEYQIRAFAFVISAFFWQIYSILLMKEADDIYKRKKSTL